MSKACRRLSDMWLIGIIIVVHSRAEALEQLVSRVALITGHPVQLVAAAAGSAVGLPGKPSTCEAAQATQVQLSTTAGLLVVCILLSNVVKTASNLDAAIRPDL